VDERDDANYRGADANPQAACCSRPSPSWGEDLRTGHDDLSAHVVRNFGRDPLPGHLFLFTDCTRTRAEVLVLVLDGPTRSGSSRGDSRCCSSPSARAPRN
jgi:hypothetical protein